RWDLSDLLPDAADERIGAALAQIERRVEEIEAGRATLDELTGEGLLGLVRLYEAMTEEMTILGAYAGLRFSADTQDEEAIALRNRVNHELTGLGNRILFFPLWWKGLSEDRAGELERAAAAAGADPDASFYLLDQRRLRRYALDESSEQLINTKDADGIGGLLTVFSMLTNRLTFKMEIDGREQELTRDELISQFLSADGTRRQSAYQELGRVLEHESKVLGQIYTHRVRDWHSENVKLRGYASPLAVRNLSNDVPDEAVEALLDTTERNAVLFHRYFQIKAGWLGSDRLRRYDLYAPFGEGDRRVDYSDAVETVLGTFAAFHPRFAHEARRVFEHGHIDSEIRTGKRGGAFCASVLPRLTPWVHVNYTGRLRDVATLAHEMGHAIHGMLASEHSILTFHPSLPLAETASVFAEILVTERLLAATEDPQSRRELLAGALDDIYATVVRQAFFVRFEIAAHAAILENRTTEALCDLYLENLERQFGSSVEIAPEFRYEWLGIPHLYSVPFYCYAYAFGQLLVLALYRRYQEDPESFRAGYLRLLSYGGAARPQAILAEADIDIGDPGFWQGGFDVVAGMIDRFEAG
ncbi:MAG TPA: M3 family oligoendopeptidase, partial [Thermoanaerobaculia bacterium]|nr:M3 family oligoendopeptidase [Thermoanaerobaculia bacterium]